jgi:hypothetical protein
MMPEKGIEESMHEAPFVGRRAEDVAPAAAADSIREKILDAFELRFRHRWD